MLDLANHHLCLAQASLQVDPKDKEFRKKEASTKKEIRREDIDQHGWKRINGKIQK